MADPHVGIDVATHPINFSMFMVPAGKPMKNEVEKSFFYESEVNRYRNASNSAIGSHNTKNKDKSR